jgi:hypothetical protein
MGFLLLLLSIALSIANLVCLIFVLIKLFPAKGVLWGIFGVICGIYTFIWGWQNAENLNIKQTMLIWSGCFAGSIILNIIMKGMR